MNTNHSRSVPSVLIAVLGVLFVVSLGWFIYSNWQSGMTSWDLVSSAILLAVPLALLYGSIGLLLFAWQQRRNEGKVSARVARYIYHTPRTAGVLIILFVTMFSLDMFGTGEPIGQMILGFLMHSLPAIIMAILLVIAWRWEWVGTVAFAAASLFFMRFLFSGSGFDIGHFLLFSGPMAVIALLFWANWKWKKQLHPASRGIEAPKLARQPEKFP